ncbi:MAG: CinA family protein [Anaerolineales bacterium]
MAEKPLEAVLGELLLERNLRLAVAESCTGGLIGHLITNVPGSSGYFSGGVIAYSNEIKMRLLGVSEETLEKYGAVSEQTVREMAYGVRRALGTDIGAAISGIAGPQGGTVEKPVGLTWIGLSAPGVENAWRYVWSGTRLDVKQQSAQQVLRILVGFVMGEQPG